VLLRTLAEWNGIKAVISVERRQTIECALLMKLLVLIARDGLHLRSGKRLGETLMQVWDDEGPSEPMMN
jgi:hypothetical protein